MTTTNIPDAVQRTGSKPQSEVDASDTVADSENTPKSHWMETITLPRWVVYAQAALLGIGGTFFFLFGILVGHFTGNNNGEVSATFDCSVSGSVAYRIDGDLKADEGAVVFFLPADKKPDRRAEGSLVNPGTFKPLDNVAIDRIHELGGAVSRTDEDGQFNVKINASYGAGTKYFLLIVSKNKRGVDTAQITKVQNATISSFFAPVEDVIDDRSYEWIEITADQDQLVLPEIEL